MAVIEGGTSAVLAEVGAVAAKALHTINKPQDHGALGHYAVQATTGTIAAGAAAASQIFHARWTDATRFALINEVTLDYFRSQGTGFTAGETIFRLTFLRAWSADGSGGTTLTLTGDNNQLRTSMGASLFGAIRISSTAALTAGTSTPDTHDLTEKRLLVGTTTNAIWNVTAAGLASGMGLPIVMFKADIASGEHPIVLAQNEGIAVRATVPATGTWSITVGMKWAEVAAF